MYNSRRRLALPKTWHGYREATGKKCPTPSSRSVRNCQSPHWPIQLGASQPGSFSEKARKGSLLGMKWCEDRGQPVRPLTGDLALLPQWRQGVSIKLTLSRSSPGQYCKGNSFQQRSTGTFTIIYSLFTYDVYYSPFNMWYFRCCFR